jgi:hypothetical protein
MSPSQPYVERAIEDGNEHFGKHKSKLYPVLVAILLTSTACIVIANYYNLFTHGFSSASDPDIRVDRYDKSNLHTNCGTSPSMARSRGCSFDLLSFAWQTPECYDEPLISSFLAYPTEPWRYYTNSSATEEVPQAVAALGEMDLYMTWEFHLSHCTFLWLQMHRGFTDRGYIDSHLDSWDHTKHCQTVILERKYGSEIVNVEGKVKYPECRPVRGPLFPGQSGKAKDLSL